MSSDDAGYGQNRVEFLIRMSVIGLLLYLCVQIAAPFAEPLLWGVILAVGLRPPFDKVASLLGERRKTTSVLMVLLFLSMILVPVLLLGDSLVTGVQYLAHGLRDGTLKVPPPPERVATWPLVGAKVSNLWRLASDNLSAFLDAEALPLKDLGGKLVGLITGTFRALLQFVAAIIIAAVMLTRANSGAALAASVAARLTSDRGAEFIALATRTIRSVATGILGVALLQSALAGVGLLAASVPAAGLLTLVVLVACVIQLGPGLVMIPTAIYLFSTGDTLTASLFTAWTVILMPLDNILKPLLLGRGVKAPMVVIFIGALGGFFRSGIIGLFTGAVVLVLGHTLFQSWLKAQAPAAPAAPATPAVTS